MTSWSAFQQHARDWRESGRKVRARGSPMRDCLLTKCVVAYVAIVSLSLSSLLAQEVPKSDDESFDIEPPLLVKPWEPQSAPDDSGEDAVPIRSEEHTSELQSLTNL